MGVYVALGLAAAVFAFVRVVVFLLMGLRASRKLHSDLLASVLAAPMSFFGAPPGGDADPPPRPTIQYPPALPPLITPHHPAPLLTTTHNPPPDTTPIGRLISRFTKDMDAIDVQLPQSMGMFLTCAFFIVATLAAIVFATPWFALVVVPVLFIYSRVMTYFRNVSREVKRFDSITRSPIYAHFSETLGGLAVIRAYGLSAAFAAANEARVGDNVVAWYTLRSCDRWLSVRLETLGNFVVLAAALLAVGTSVNTSRFEGSAAGLTGFSLTYAMTLTGLMNWAVRTAADTEQVMTSVERVCEYHDSTPREPYEAPGSGGSGSGGSRSGSRGISSAAEPPLVAIARVGVFYTRRPQPQRAGSWRWRRRHQ